MSRVKEDYCSLCGRLETEVFKLIRGPDKINICDGCVDLCAEIVKEARTPRPEHPRAPP